MATTEKLQNEILVKEEAFLKEEKAKLTEQLNKLKVRNSPLSTYNYLRTFARKSSNIDCFVKLLLQLGYELL